MNLSGKSLRNQLQFHDFKGICKDAIKTAKDLKKKFGDKLTEEKILEFVNEEVQAKKEKTHSTEGHNLYYVEEVK